MKKKNGDARTTGRPSQAFGAPVPQRMIAISLPSHEMVPVLFAYDAMRMAAISAASLIVDGVTDITHNIVLGTYIQQARQDLVDIALAQGATHMLWMDTDHRFPKDALIQLLNRNVDMVGINYANRKVPPGFVAYKHVGWDGEPSEKCVTDETTSGLEPVDALGFGLVLMRTSIIRNIGPKPWFEVYYDTEHNRIVGEDCYFCKKVRDAGYEIYVDHDLSKECSHLGTFEYRLEHAADWQKRDEDVDNHIFGAPDSNLELVESE